MVDNVEKSAPPIRILHCVAGLGRGGYEAFIMNVYRNIDRAKLQFDFLYSFDGVYVAEIKALGGRLYQIPFITQNGPFAYKSAVYKFLQQHKEYTIVHSHMDKFSGLIMREAKKAGVKTRIAHSHNTNNEGGIAFHLVKNYYGCMINKSCTDRFACSHDAAKWLFGNYSPDAIVVKNAIDSTKFTPVDNRERGMLTIACIARFTPQKNHSFLIDIFNELHTKNVNSRLLLAGSGELVNTIKEKTTSLGLDTAVTFLNDCDDIPLLLSRCDVLCAPSLFEGLGIVLIEAQACGVKCVASDTIPREVGVSSDITFLPLSSGAKVWADAILNLDVSVKNNNLNDIISEGYDIRTTCEFLTDFYNAHT